MNLTFIGNNQPRRLQARLARKATRVAAILVGLLVGLLVGCGQQPTEPDQPAEPEQPTTTVTQVEATATSAPEVDTDKAETAPTTAKPAAGSEIAADQEAAGPNTPFDNLLAEARHVQGAPDAPLVFIEFSDFK